MPYRPLQAPPNLDLDGLRQYDEDQAREVERSWTELEDVVVSYSSQTKTAAERSQARANIGVTQKNYIVNGAMMVSQENGSTGGSTVGFYPVDQFVLSFSTTGATSTVRSAAPTPGGSPNRLRVQADIADTSIAASEYLNVLQPIEGLRVADLRIGSASAKTVTLRFGVKAPAGTYCVGFHNGAAARSYVAEYAIAAGEANTDVVKSVTVALDQTGTWANDTAIGLYVRWALMAGTTWRGTANVWQAGNVFATANQFNFMGTAGGVFELFDVSLTEGSAAPPFVVPDYASELLTCQRYYYKTDLAVGPFGVSAIGGAAAASHYVGATYSFHVRMRITPTCALFGSWTLVNCPTPTFWIGTPDHFNVYTTSTAAGNVTFYGGGITANARM